MVASGDLQLPHSVITGHATQSQPQFINHSTPKKEASASLCPVANTAPSPSEILARGFIEEEIIVRATELLYVNWVVPCCIFSPS